ncbi:uncharacterized protein LOC122861167 [Aphidius gifuensis]|uniref:uncharacterized protein LOC122861167 n=1 Tax=Aphidius gifuensis TaxID=684658 RepID=UPI001CDCC574|nr:uncharacterized protein LOC122861167 [Aphidius gifuensis]
MSAISRMTLRLVGTAKYTTNNSTYRQSMMLTPNRLNHSIFQPNNLNNTDSEKLQNTQTNEISTNFWTTIRAAKKKILAIFGKEIKTSNISDFEVTLGSSRASLFSQEIEEKCIFPSIFRTELNGKSINPRSNVTHKKKRSFKVGKWWNASLFSDSLVLHLLNHDKIFILKHVVDVKAHISPLKIAKNGGVHTPRKLDYDIAISPVKITSDPMQSGFNETDAPDGSEKMKLHFPMSVSLENQQIIKIKDSDDTFTVYHTIDIEAFDKNLPEFLANRKKYIVPGIGILEIALESGDLLIQPKYSRNKSIMVKQEVYIKIDVDSEIPSILVCPRLKKFHGAAGNKILSIFKEEIKTSDISDFKVSLGSSLTSLFAQEIEEKCIFPSIFRTELNGKSINPRSNVTHEKEMAFKVGKWWNASLPGDSLVLRYNHNKFFILKHVVDVKAHISPLKIAKNSGVHTPRELDFNVAISPVKITSDPMQSSFNETDAPDGSEKMKLHFPMSVSLENQQIIKIKDSDDTFTVFHTIDIDAYEEKLPEIFSSHEIKKTSQIGIFEIALKSGDLLIQPKYSSNGSIMMKQKVYIKIDVNGEIPSILVCPRLKNFHGPEIN